MPTYYNSKKIIPSPQVSFAREFQTQDDGTPLGSGFVITVVGKLVAIKGSPNSEGIFWDVGGYPPDEEIPENERLKSILKKQKHLSELFSQEGKSFEVQPWDGTAPTKCNPRVRSISFQEGNWIDVCDYTITLECDVLFLDGIPLGASDVAWQGQSYISKFGENWTIDQADINQGTYTLTHTLSATGKRIYNEDGTLLMPAWEQAKNYILTGLAQNSPTFLGPKVTRTGLNVVHANAMGFYDYRRSQQIDETGGVYSVTESWVCLDLGRTQAEIDAGTPEEKIQQKYPSTYDVNMVKRLSDGKTTMSVEGTITGLSLWTTAPLKQTYTKFANAQQRWTSVKENLVAEIARVTEFSANTDPTSTQIGYNERSGVITFNYEYDPAQAGGITGAISEVITIIDRNPNDIYASIAVPYRNRGPILQDVHARGAKVRTINFDLVMKDGNRPSKTELDQRLTGIYFPSKDSTRKLFLDSDEESWSPSTRRYTRSTTVTYESNLIDPSLKDLWKPPVTETSNILIGGGPIAQP